MGILAVVIVVIVIFVVNFTSPAVLAHKLIFSGTTLFTSSSPIPVSSDAVDTIVYGTSKGVVLYDTEKKTSSIINTSVATGLAYSEKDDLFFMLEANGNISSLSRTGEKVVLMQGGVKLFDLVGGVYMKIGNDESYITTSGDKTPANGNYGLIQLTIS